MQVFFPVPVPCPAVPSETAEWLKTLFSVLGGLVVGVLLTPLTYRLTRWSRDREMKQALYSELAQMTEYARLIDRPREMKAPPNETPEEKRFRLANRIRTAVYDYYANSEKAAFLRMRESSAFIALYQVLESFSESGDVGLVKQLDDVREQYASWDEFDSRLYDKHAAKHRARYLNRLARSEKQV
jgi:hypothetical protein